MPHQTPNAAHEGPSPELHGASLDQCHGVGALTIGGFFEEICARFSESEALVFDDPFRAGATVRWTYARLRDEAHRVAKALLAVGVEKGTPVGLLMANRPEAVAAFFGAACAGALVVPLSTFSTRPEIEYLLEDAGIEVLLLQSHMGSRNFATDLAEIARSEHLRDIVCLGPADGSDGVTTASASRALTWETFLEVGSTVDDKQLTEATAAMKPNDLGVVIYSSGTTDRPKGVLHHQQAPTLQFWVQAQIFGRHDKTRMWSALPLFWTAGMNTAMGATLAAGGCWVMQEGFDAGVALALIEREHVTEPYTLPHQAKAMEEHPNWLTTDLSSLRCVYGKSVFPRHPTVDGDPGWCMPVGYGLSETCAFFASHYSNDPRHLLRESIGRLLPGNVLRIQDQETGERLGPNQEGEFVIKGPTLMLRYLNRRTEECLDPEGFFHTGDLGFFDENGFVHWTGRSTEMIKTGGANVSPAEIEVQLRACPPVKLARVLGVPDPRLDQIAVLCLELKDGASATEGEIRDFLRSRLASYKVPKTILFFADGEIPMTQSRTKVRDDALLALVTARLQASSRPQRKT